MRQIASLIALLLFIPPAFAGKPAMKEIKYRGGVVTFSIPKNWVEEYEPDGGGMFYEDAPNTGTLRLNVITAQAPKLLSEDAAFEELAALKSIKAENIQRLPNGNAIAVTTQRSSERGHAITLFWWYVANPIRPNYLRLANFSYTVLTSQEDSPSTKREVQLLTESIKNAKFHPTLGQ